MPFYTLVDKQTKAQCNLTFAAHLVLKYTESMPRVSTKVTKAAIAHWVKLRFDRSIILFVVTTDLQNLSPHALRCQTVDKSVFVHFRRRKLGRFE